MAKTDAFLSGDKANPSNPDWSSTLPSVWIL